MCGIAGFVGSFPLERIGAMRDAVAHRGPDDAGVWTDERAGVALGHRRLSIIDLRPEARQPMANEDESVLVVFNGEIYNYRALREGLLGRGHRFRSVSDTEVLVHLYEEDGIDMVRRLNGIFAFGLWDVKRRSLYVVRDPMGVKPLYFSELPQGFLFASELKALLVHPELPRDLDHEAIHQHLSYVWSPAPHTLFRAVRKLEPGYLMQVENGLVKRHEAYYDIPYDGGRTEADPREIEESIRGELERSVRMQMVSDVPVGAFLSGGVDSTAIVTMMGRVSNRPVDCYTIALDGEVDENPEDLPYARLAAKRLGATLKEVRIRPDVAAFIEKMVWLLDEPQADPACINVYLLCQQARADGIKVLLSGAGGDDIFSGYRRHMALGLERYWSWAPLAVREGVSSLSAGLPTRHAITRRVRKALAHAGAPPEERLVSYFLWTDDETIRQLSTPMLRDSLVGHDTLEPLRRSLARIPGETDPLNRMLYLEAKHFLADHNLNYTDKMSMAHGVEVRVPFLDVDLVRFATRVPPRLKSHGMEVKVIFRQAMEPLLPREILLRRKTGFGAPLRRWIRTELREMVRDVLDEGGLRRRGLFEPEAVRRLIEDNERRRVDGAYLIFSLMCVEMWLRAFVDRPAAAA